jgi:hypothetical protein
VKRVRLAYSAFAYANPPFWIAQDLKFLLALFYENSKKALVMSVHKSTADLGIHDARGRSAGLSMSMVDGVPGFPSMAAMGRFCANLTLGNADALGFGLFRYTRRTLGCAGSR